MKRQELQDFCKKGRAVVSSQTYAIVKARRACADAFAVIRDDKETTCVLEESKIRSQKYLGVEGDWRRITFDMILPFSLVGFIALVSGALAKEGISIFAISTYSTDHVFVKSRDVERAIRTLRGLGMDVRRA